MTEQECKILHRVERNQFIDSLRHKETQQGRFDAAVWHLDHPIPGTDLYLGPSDHGAGAERLYAALEPPTLWRQLYDAAYRRLPSNGKKVLKALEVDWRSRPAAKIAGVSQPTVDLWKKSLKFILPNVYGHGSSISAGSKLFAFSRNLVRVYGGRAIRLWEVIAHPYRPRLADASLERPQNNKASVSRGCPEVASARRGRYGELQPRQSAAVTE